MAKIEGTQNIPAEWLDLYRATITEKLPSGVSRKRYPFRIPLRQSGGYKVTNAQKNQRTRFLTILEKFRGVTQAQRQRWYAARPEWSSLLWYFNYFILSGLRGNANVNQGGHGVIKLIQHIKAAIPTDGTTLSLPTAVDPIKAVVMAWGGAHNHAADQGGDLAWAWAWACYPVPLMLNSSQFSVDWSETPEAAGAASFMIIEYI